MCILQLLPDPLLKFLVFPSLTLTLEELGLIVRIMFNVATPTQQIDSSIDYNFYYFEHLYSYHISSRFINHYPNHEARKSECCENVHFCTCNLEI